MLRSFTLGILGVALLTSAPAGMSASGARDAGLWEGIGPNVLVVASPVGAAVAPSPAPINLGPID